MERAVREVPAQGQDILRRELVRLLDDPGGAPGADDALDALWIARLSGVDPVDFSTLLDEDAVPEPEPPPAEPPTSPPRDDRPGPDDETDTPTARLHLPGGDESPAPDTPRTAYAIRVAQPQALTDPLALTRALRHLRQSVPSARARTLDVEATATACGDTGLLLPVMRPATERRFSVDLLIDTSTTMTVWQRLAEELHTLLAQHGAFADVRGWALHTDGHEPTLARFRRGAQATTPTRSWSRALADPTGRRAVLVLTDGVGPAWYGSELRTTLADWSRSRPVVAFQVLPSRLWHRTALRTAPVRARVPDPERATIEVRSPDPLPGIPRGRAGADARARIRWLPVLEVSGDWLGPWARLVSGRTTDWVPLRAAPLTEVETPTQVMPSDEPSTPAAWVEAFEEGYSPEAFSLLRLLAAAPLSLPVMRLVQRTMLPASTPMHLAEIFLSGILVRRGPAEPGTDPDSVLYDFRDGVRDALLDRLTRTESLRVLSEVIDGVSARVASTFGGVTDFRALVAAVGEGEGDLDGLELPEDSRAFAEVALAVIGGVGGDYGEVAAKLARGRAGAGGVPPATAADRVREEKEEAQETDWLERLRRPLPVLWRRRRERSERERETAPSADPSTLLIEGDGEPLRNRLRVASNVPPLPDHYVRRQEAAAFIRSTLLRGSPRVATRYPAEGPTRAVIRGGAGVGKTALAIDLAQELAEHFTMVRWIRAHSRETLWEDLAFNLPRELGWLHSRSDKPFLDGGLPVLSALWASLREVPGWLLVYDGVTQETFETHRRYPELGNVWLPPDGYGSVLMTTSERSLPLPPTHDVVPLEDLDRDGAVFYLRQASLALHGGDLGPDRAALAELVDAVGTNQQHLAHLVPTLDTFLGSLVAISTRNGFIGTGVAVRPDVVLACGFGLPTEEDLLVTPLAGGSGIRVTRTEMQIQAPGLIAMRLEGTVRSSAPLAEPGSGAAVAVWLEGEPRRDRELPLRLSPASSMMGPTWQGVALIDADGRLRSVAARTDGGTVIVDVTEQLVDQCVSMLAAPVVQVSDRGPEPTPREAPRQGPLFFLSCPRANRTGQEHRFFTDLTERIMELTTLDSVGFMDEGLPPGSTWREEINHVLAGARVFVPLVSPGYFNSLWCRREWDLASWRRSMSGGDGSPVTPAIVPVLWVPTHVTELPPDARDMYREYVKIESAGYAEQGLLSLMEDGPVELYRHVVRRIAQAILEADPEP